MNVTFPKEEGTVNLLVNVSIKPFSRTKTNSFLFSPLEQLQTKVERMALLPQAPSPNNVRAFLANGEDLFLIFLVLKTLFFKLKMVMHLKKEFLGLF